MKGYPHELTRRRFLLQAAGVVGVTGGVVGCRGHLHERGEVRVAPLPERTGCPAGAQAVTAWGAVGDGRTDDTAAIQAAANASGHLYFPPGTYQLSLQQGADALRLSGRGPVAWVGDRARLRMRDGEVATGDARMLLLHDCENVRIEGLTFDGNRANRSPPFHGNSHCIGIRGGRNICLRRLLIVDSTHDGVYVRGADESNASTYPFNLRLEDVHVIHSFRNGLSLIGARRVVIAGGQYSYSRGAAPAAGIDIEPNPADAFGVQDVSIRDVAFEGSDGTGLVVTGSTGTQTREVSVLRMSGRANRGGLLHIASGADITVRGVSVWGDPVAIRPFGLVTVGDAQGKVTLGGLSFQGVTGMSRDRTLVHVDNRGGSVAIDGLRAANVSCSVLTTRRTCSTRDVVVEQIRGEHCLALLGGIQQVSGVTARGVSGTVIHAAAEQLSVERVRLRDCDGSQALIRVLSSGSILKDIEVVTLDDGPLRHPVVQYSGAATPGRLSGFRVMSASGREVELGRAVEPPSQRP